MQYLLVPLLFWLFLCVCGIAPLIVLRFAKYAPVANPIPIFEKALTVLDPRWIQETGFLGMYAIKPLGIPMAIFTNEHNTIVMVVYSVGGQHVMDLVSEFPADISLTTSTSIDGPVVPAPLGVMFQTFRGKDAKELLHIHENGIDFLRTHLNADLIPQEDVASSIKTFIGRQLNHLCMRPWNALALPYRWAVTRFVRMNLTVEQQEQKRIIDLDSLRRQSQALM